MKKVVLFLFVLAVVLGLAHFICKAYKHGYCDGAAVSAVEQASTMTQAASEGGETAEGSENGGGEANANSNAVSALEKCKETAGKYKAQFDGKCRELKNSAKEAKDAFMKFLAE